MTKKDFELIAATLQTFPDMYRSECAVRLADVLARTNDRFNRDRFLRACLPGANVKARA